MADGPRAVILAAGQGTRMKSAVPKVLHPLAGRPMLLHVVAVAEAATGREPVVVVNPDHAGVADALRGHADPVPQATPRGTGDALRSLPIALRGGGSVVVINGDLPLLRVETVKRLIAAQARSGAACVLLSVVPSDPSGLGRIVRDGQGRVVEVVEERELPAGVAAPAECNAGAYVFAGERLWAALEGLSPENSQGEYYLTDVVRLLGGDVEAVLADDPEEGMGINDRVQLAAAESVLRRRRLVELMRSGVTIEDPATTYVEADVVVGQDSVIRPMTLIRGHTVIGRNCEIGPMAQLRDVLVGNGVRIGTSVVEEAEIRDGVSIGDFNRVRPNTVLETGVSLGTHAEVKNSTVGADSRISHFSCVLDSDVGSGVNVGAGTVTCNYDGVGKHRTVIDDGAFVGSNSTLVAPVEIGRDAYVAAGSIVTMSVPEGALAVGRARQRNIEGWRQRRRDRATAR
jgi:bifunctional UDP-N-acetylglucosamine pyrophosphorylase / glucosamine-1-phosphate N-acetyltransferase